MFVIQELNLFRSGKSTISSVIGILAKGYLIFAKYVTVISVDDTKKIRFENLQTGF